MKPKKPLNDSLFALVVLFVFCVLTFVAMFAIEG